ncbi:UDP-N-acetylmuramate:L-alanyl-gamma-D-glutamyl-meso-diaminopimelate ligase [Solimonas soli]|uniref:UDP-N-acetylmuramate:L-alanyl-gamma-D-glutamyl- meso-diaminopimelate ligase n=1 Tax=Solimonas soli TaxID=413479 RepID=UPI0004801676|nr:UDP-N-acetylmuramate:L-alanyl-gamma-D-glutamyl-meso-diaminopimelate ligase [Solimonas soli]
MHIHILGICGTFMAGIAAIAREAGHTVTGSDANAWPPMSTQLEALGITVMQGYEPKHLQPAPDMVVVGNVVTRGNAAMEYVLDEGLPYTSGPQWLAENVLRDRHVLAVAGTHGKTTTTSLLAWLLEHAGLAPGFLVGGVPQNFGISARLGASKYFVIEADEYDTAFFDKRSKFVHYRPRTAILNNLEYDHADIFPDLAAIERQFHHLVRTVPGSGRLVVNGDSEALARVLAQGCWSEVVRFSTDGSREHEWWGGYGGECTTPGGFELVAGGLEQGCVATPLPGLHNVANTLAAFAAAEHVGVPVATLIEGLQQFTSVKRRLEVVGEARGVTVYDDFAHHPTAIEVTIAALRRQTHGGRVLAVLEPRSNTMRLGTHADELALSLRDADLCFVYARPDLKWDAKGALAGVGSRLRVAADLEALIAAIAAEARSGDRVLVMSNGDFGGIHGKLLKRLAA